jgi:NADPH:quinone reductase-like Zn-dependent oxidoreductase
MENKKMRAVICTKYGGPEVLQLKEVDKPVPKDNEVLIKNFVTTVHVGDVRMRKFDVPRAQWLLARIIIGIRKPKKVALGMELSGVVEAVGKDVTLYKKGDTVFAGSFWTASSYAEYVCMSEDGALAIKPSNMTFEEAAAGATTGGVTALVILKKANIKPGQKILINGASGSIGTYAVQFCKVFGAEVTGVCSTTNLELVRSLGADKVIDYTKENFWDQSEKYDVIFDAVSKLNKSQAKKSLKKTGIYLDSDKDSGGSSTDHIPPLIKEIKELIEKGSIKAVIDKRFPLEQIVEAHKYVETGRKKGHVVITVAQEE